MGGACGEGNDDNLGPDCKKKPTPYSRCAMFVGEPKYTKRMLLEGIVPKPRNKVLKKKYKKQCFELFSWCNQMCPRDDDESVDHKYCKNCFATAVYPAEVKSDSLTRNQKVPFLKFKK